MKTTFLTAAALSLALHPAFAQVETTPPPPAAPRQLQIPKPAEKTLANGLRVIVIEKKGVPLVAARLLIKNGGEADPNNLDGLADSTASLLTKGTTTKSAEEIARGIEALGATLDTGAGWDAAAHLGGNDVSIVIVGAAKKYMPKLQDRCKIGEVMQFDELAVNSAILRRGT